jgi:predicted ArsR family transcriptional regulator
MILTYSKKDLFFDAMKETSWRTRLLQSTRGRILELLQTKERTVNELAATLRLTDNAVRAHLIGLERDSLVAQAGVRPGVRKPHATYTLTADAEQIFPKAYGMLLSLFLTVFSEKLTPRELPVAMRAIGRKVADRYRTAFEGKNRKQRIDIALNVLKELGGSASLQESEGGRFIRGRDCPLAAATARHPQACQIAESLLSEIIGAPVKEHCVHDPTPSCCFKIR